MGELEVKAIREIEAAFNRGDIGAMVACLASDAEWEIAEANPSARTLHGQAEIRAYLEDWRDTVQGLHYEGERYIDAGDVVVQVGTMTARPSAGGAELTVPLAFVSRFRDGVPVRTEEYLDVDAALEAAGLPD
jgi:ketosteroid isomerase-like protein